MCDGSSRIILGWEVDGSYRPKYWVRRGRSPKAGSQQDSDLVGVEPDRIGFHTAIIAQSGSGKSFFLGRLIEEILTGTRSRCLVLDPNGDFLMAGQVSDPGPWDSPTYDHETNTGVFPHEASRKEFLDLWSPISINILSVRRFPTETERAPSWQNLRLPWLLLSIDAIASDVDPGLRADLFHCHEFVQAVGKLSRSKSRVFGFDVIAEAEELLRLMRRVPSEDRRGLLEWKFDLAKLCSEHAQERKAKELKKAKSELGNILDSEDEAILQSRAELAVKAEIEEAINTLFQRLRYISDSAERLYFGKARAAQYAGIFEPSIPEGIGDERLSRLEVVDLSSIERPSVMRLAVSAILSREWSRKRNEWFEAMSSSGCDKRVPTFLVVDEAHNLMPANTDNEAAKALREQLRTIAAEGRKFGLYLVIVSQRPDKLDSLAVSECENKVVMRLGSESVVKNTAKVLGVEDHMGELKNCLDFNLGRGLLMGRWSPKPQAFYVAARRTVEGGKNLEASYWARPLSSLGDEKD